MALRVVNTVQSPLLESTDADVAFNTLRIVAVLARQQELRVQIAQTGYEVIHVTDEFMYFRVVSSLVALLGPEQREQLRTHAAGAIANLALNKSIAASFVGTHF